MRGSSPLARGGPAAADSLSKMNGLIPAGAGRTPTPATVSRGTWAHPRWRGEDRAGGGEASRMRGSSPLARGGLQRH